MSNKVKDFIVGVIVTIIFAVIMGSCIWYGTSPEVWYADMHTEGCDGTNNCECYEKLIKMDNERAGK